MQAQVIRIRASAEMASKIDEAAAVLSAKSLHRVTRSDVIRAACAEYLQRNSSGAIRCTRRAL